MTDTYETIRQALIAHSGTPNLDAFHDEASAICEALARADEHAPSVRDCYDGNGSCGICDRPDCTPAAPERGSSRVHDPEPQHAARCYARGFCTCAVDRSPLR